MIAFLIGAVLGAVFFGGLYLSTKKINEVKYPSLFMIASFFIRMGLLVGVFYYVSKGGYKDMLLTLVGVILMRFILIFSLKEKSPN